ncbi:hypothetical protein ACROYT_G015445 [Oculina patagonica]
MMQSSIKSTILARRNGKGGNITSSRHGDLLFSDQDDVDNFVDNYPPTGNIPKVKHHYVGTTLDACSTCDVGHQYCWASSHEVNGIDISLLVVCNSWDCRAPAQNQRGEAQKGTLDGMRQHLKEFKDKGSGDTKKAKSRTTVGNT